MIKYLLKHQWLQFTRAASFEREMAITIVIWIIALFGLLSLFSLAMALPEILENNGIQDPIAFVNLALIYYFFGELFMRYFLQKTPVLDIEPYLNLPIKRGLISGFLVGKSLISLFNIISLFLVLPFALRIIVPQYGTLEGIAWVAGVFLISLCLHFLNLLFKKKLEDMPVVWAIIVILVAGNYFLSTYYNFDLFKPLSQALEGLITVPSSLLILLVAVIVLLLVTLKFYRGNLYLEELETKSSNHMETYSQRLSFLGASSLSNTLMLQEIRMMLRHKRTRSLLILSLLFVFYGLLFFGREGIGQMKGFHIFLGIFMSGIFTINYGQFFWSWNTNQLDFFLTKPIVIKSWLRSRYRILLIGTVISVILCSPYLYFGWEILFLLVGAGIYNIGINIPMMMRLALWGPKAIDLNKSSVMNYQGAGAAQWIMGIPLLAGPYIVYVPVNIFFGHVAGIAALALVGILGLTLNDYFLTIIAKKFDRVKYKLIHDLTI
jgi:hypothetical protein